MDDFVKLISELKSIKYRNGKNNIESDIENVGNLLYYVFKGKESPYKVIKDYNNYIFDEVNNEIRDKFIESYSLTQKDNLIIINKNSFKINVIINYGHASIEDKIDDIYKVINDYEYLDILYTFNYTKDDSINFCKNFINFCKKQNKDIQDFLIKKIINIQNINLKIKNSKDEAGNTCLHIACLFDNVDKLIEFIKNKYTDVNSVDNSDNTPFLTTFINCSKNVLNILLKMNF